jgi:peptidoglycan-associated lipoprotein
MMKPILKYLQTCFVVIAGIGLVAGCAEQAQVKPWDNTSQGRITFTFDDTDMDKGEIAGDIVLDLPASLKPTGVSNYVVYWSSSSQASGQGEKLAEVPVNISGKVLYSIPEDTGYSEESGSHFLLYLKGTKGEEVFSGKSTAFTDNVEEVVEEAVPEVPQAEEPVAADVSTAIEEPTVDAPEVGAGVSAADADVPEVGAVEEEAVAAEPPPVVVVQEEVPQIEEITIVIENVLFEFDRSYLKSEFKERLRADFESIENKGEVQLLIAGHADERGSNEYNLALGERRAYAVKRYLISMGFQADNVQIISYGEEKPLDGDHSENAWSKNRRSETEIVEE